MQLLECQRELAQVREEKCSAMQMVRDKEEALEQAVENERRATAEVESLRSVRPPVVSVVTRLREQYSCKTFSNLLKGRSSISVSAVTGGFDVQLMAGIECGLRGLVCFERSAWLCFLMCSCSCASQDFIQENAYLLSTFLVDGARIRPWQGSP